MSISTYTGLKSAIADWLLRDDLAAVIPTFISLAEADIARKLRHRLDEKRVSTSLNEQYEVLPNDWLETVSINHTDGTEIRLVSTVGMADLRRGGSASGKPMYYRISANEIEVYPTPDAEYPIELTYNARIPALSDAAPTNWLLTNNPDVFLYGALLHSAPYLSDDARAQVWGTLFEAAVAAMNAQSEAAKYSGPLVMRNKRA
jgi:hypothetical protein